MKLQASFDNPLEWAPQLEKTRKATKLTIPLPSVMGNQPPTIFPCFVFRPAQVVIAEDGIAVRDERKRQSRRIGKLGKGRAGLLEKPVRLYVGYSVNLYTFARLSRFLNIVSFCWKAGTRFQEVERARHCIKFKKIQGDGPDEGFVWYYKGRDVGNLQFPPICAVATVSKVS